MGWLRMALQAAVARLGAYQLGNKLCVVQMRAVTHEHGVLPSPSVVAALQHRHHLSARQPQEPCRQVAVAGRRQVAAPHGVAVGGVEAGTDDDELWVKGGQYGLEQQIVGGLRDWWGRRLAVRGSLAGVGAGAELRCGCCDEQVG